MSLFNLDRFRFDKKGDPASTDKEGSSRPGTPKNELDEKPMTSIPETPENKRLNNVSLFKKDKGVRFLDSESEIEDQESQPSMSSTHRKAHPREENGVSESATDDSADECPPPKTTTATNISQVNDGTKDEKLEKLKEIFPQRTSEELLQLIQSTDTLEDAVAAGIARFDDKEKNSSRKRKADDRPQDGVEEKVAKKEEI